MAEPCVGSVPEMTVDDLRAIFKPFDIRYNPEKYKLEYPDGVFRRASVLIPLCFKKGEYHVILTLRSETLTHHAGYVAFPGGMRDDTDEDEIETALREAEEEIGLNPKDVEIISVCSPGIVKPNSLVYPVIGIVSGDFNPVINEREVSMVFELPLKRFLLTERRRVSTFKSSSTSASYYVHHFIDTVREKELDTWGFTASFCVMTALGVYQSDQSFCFYSNFITNKDTIFSNTSTMDIINGITKLTSKM